MKTYRFTLQIESAFGTPLVGDSLFGQICWAIVNRYGQARLTDLLKGYLEQQPFLVVSDAFPTGYLPLPLLPSRYWKESNEDRKVLKKKQWLAVEDFQQPFAEWQSLAKSAKDVLTTIEQDHFHNTLDRQTSTTGMGEQFAPYSMSQIWYKEKQQLDLYCVIDETRFTLQELEQVLNDIGVFGFGRDASIGLGKFSVLNVEKAAFMFEEANSYLTLANSAPQNLGLDKTNSYYQLHTRFGRHGNLMALHQSPFKKPIILAKLGAVLTPLNWQETLFLGNGLANVSETQPEAVHQGYAPVFSLKITFKAEE